jgi:Arm DNA-binding domain
MLNDTRIRSAKLAERDYKLTDFDGLYLFVRKNGSRLWRFAYRFGGKQKQIALGAYPQVTLGAGSLSRSVSKPTKHNPLLLRLFGQVDLSPSERVR